jgi:hypothetical protein
MGEGQEGDSMAHFLMPRNALQFCGIRVEEVTLARPIFHRPHLNPLPSIRERSQKLIVVGLRRSFASNRFRFTDC